MKYVWHITLAGLLIMSGACSGPVIKVDLDSAPDINLNEKSEPLPVVVRIYQLTDKGAFESATFGEIWKNDNGALGATMLTRNEVVVNPSSEDRIRVDRHKQAQYVGVVAIFRTPADGNWRGLYELSTDMVSKRLSTSFDVSLAGNALHITN